MRRLATLAALLLLAAAPAARAADLPDRLAGTWHVLVHYKDANATHPDEQRWDDRVWVFEKTGDRLKWTEYPIAVFADESGRFERRSTGQLARVLGYWEPSEAQLAEIAGRSRAQSARHEVEDAALRARRLELRLATDRGLRLHRLLHGIVEHRRHAGAADLPARGLAGRRAHRNARRGDALHHHRRSTPAASGGRAASSATAAAGASSA